MTLADLKCAAELLAPGSMITVPRDALLAALNAVVESKADSESESRLLTVDQVALRMGVSRKLVYQSAAVWPFTRRVGRALRFESKGLERWLSRQR